MNTEALVCPMCGSTSVNTGSREEKIELALGEHAVLSVTENHCTACDERGDFLARNDAAIDAAIDAAEARLAARNIEVLAERGVTMAACERALGLAPRTMLRWKAGKLSDAAAALLKILRTYPWLINVARARFDQRVAETELVRHACAVSGGIIDFTDAKSANVRTRAIGSGQGFAGDIALPRLERVA